MNVGPSGKRGYSGKVAPSSDADKMKSRGGCVQDRVQSRGRLVGPSVDSEKLWKPKEQGNRSIFYSFFTQENRCFASTLNIKDLSVIVAESCNE